MRGSNLRISRSPARNAMGMSGTALQIIAGPIWSGSKPRIASDSGMRIMVVVSVKRNQKSRQPNNMVLRFSRYGNATRGFGPRRRRTSEHRRKKAPDQNQPLNTPERHQ